MRCAKVEVFGFAVIKDEAIHRSSGFTTSSLLFPQTGKSVTGGTAWAILGKVNLLTFSKAGALLSVQTPTDR